MLSLGRPSAYGVTLLCGYSSYTSFQRAFPVLSLCQIFICPLSAYLRSSSSRCGFDRIEQRCRYARHFAGLVDAGVFGCAGGQEIMIDWLADVFKIDQRKLRFPVG